MARLASAQLHRDVQLLVEVTVVQAAVPAHADGVAAHQAFGGACGVRCGAYIADSLVRCFFIYLLHSSIRWLLHSFTPVVGRVSLHSCINQLIICQPMHSLIYASFHSFMNLFIQHSHSIPPAGGPTQPGLLLAGFWLRWYNIRGSSARSLLGSTLGPYCGAHLCCTVAWCTAVQRCSLELRCLRRELCRSWLLGQLGLKYLT